MLDELDVLECTLPDREREDREILRIQEEVEECDVVFVLVGRLMGTGRG